MKNLIVQKYGGSSVATPERILAVAKRIASYKKKKHRIVVVVSALGDTTDNLIELAHRVTSQPSEREVDMLISTGEQVSIALLAMALHKFGVDAISFTGAQVGIMTDSRHTKAKVLDINAERIRRELRKDKVVIVAGFQGVDTRQNITTLGRGGSDLTAVALAKVLSAATCEIYTDVNGVYTADPRIVAEARLIPYISYDEMFELASLGAQVMQARSIEVAKKFHVPLHIRSSFSSQEGTMISKETKALEAVVVSGIALKKDEAKVTLCDIPDRPGIAAKIFDAISKAGINVDMIVQNVGRTAKADMSFTVARTELGKTMPAIKKIAKALKAPKVLFDDDIAKISVIGIGMRSHSGVAATMFKALASKKINIEMISTSEIKISCIVARKHAEEAARVLHKAFGLDVGGKKIKKK
ncbi:MAG: aspartate kinase [Candidatus Omnitrophica bacterium]|nr:aspartate kinase [Candidatus Omnitrophota bacterium]